MKTMKYSYEVVVFKNDVTSAVIKTSNKVGIGSYRIGCKVPVLVGVGRSRNQEIGTIKQLDKGYMSCCNFIKDLQAAVGNKRKGHIEDQNTAP